MLGHRNCSLLVVNNYKFSKAYTSVHGIIRWRCAIRTCKAKVYTSIEDELTVISSVTDHNHEPDQTINKQTVITRLKRKEVEEPTERPCKIMNSELKVSSEFLYYIVTYFNKHILYSIVSSRIVEFNYTSPNKFSFKIKLLTKILANLRILFIAKYDIS